MASILYAATKGYITLKYPEINKKLSLVSLYEKELFSYINTEEITDLFGPILENISEIEKEDIEEVFILEPIIEMFHYNETF